MPAGERDENGVPFEIAVPSTDPEKKKPDGDDGESGGSSGQPNGGEAKGKGKDDGKDQNEMVRVGSPAPTSQGMAQKNFWGPSWSLAGVIYLSADHLAV